jgi:UDP-galactopyranose mutase
MKIARPEPDTSPGSAVLICFSHLRWDFVFQRPQHLMSRFARSFPVIFWEEPVIHAEDAPAMLDVRSRGAGVTIVTPHLPSGLTPEATDARLAALLKAHLAARQGPLIRWYYTPMMLPFSRDLPSALTVYDCMDELANFDFAPPGIVDLEQELFKTADLVFTGGYSLFEAKRTMHPAVHPFPSSVEREHFGRARRPGADPVDQRSLAHPRLGYYGVIDERMDLALLAAVADARPDWTIVMVGPVVKIAPEALPQRPNIAYLGGKSYDELPDYVAGWDVALMPFAINASTRFISPTKTPEYLAAGLPVVSTPITDVARHYGQLSAVSIAASPRDFIAACEAALATRASQDTAWRAEADRLLADASWDAVVTRMSALMNDARRAKAPRPKPHYDYLVVGAGFAGAVMAERLAADMGKRVLVVDRRDHIGGNAFDVEDAAGILIHRYGPHIFHTNSQDIVDYLSAFTDWRPYEHRVRALVDDRLVPIPINRTTLNTLYGLSLSSDEETAAFLSNRAEPVGEPRTSEDVVVAQVGRELYEKFFRGYTRKQWGLDPSELDRSVTGRIPTRTGEDDRYFTDTFQAMPARGYTAMFEAMLDHPNIDVRLGTDFDTVRHEVGFDRLVFTGPVDEYFGYCYGRLPYRSLRFEHRTLDCPTFQPVAVVNYPDEATPFTRVTEYKHLTGQVSPNTSITYEYPSDRGDPYYPVPRAENQALFKRYEALSLGCPEVLFVGRLATYRYYNMDQVVGQALATYRRHVEQLAAAGGAPKAERA